MPYIINTSADFADEFNYPVVDILSDNLYANLLTYKNLYKDCDFDECYFGTNEWLSFRFSDIVSLIQSATYVDDATLKIVKPFLADAFWSPTNRILDHTSDNFSFDFCKDLENLTPDAFMTKHSQSLI